MAPGEKQPFARLREYKDRNQNWLLPKMIPFA